MILKAWTSQITWEMTDVTSTSDDAVDLIVRHGKSYETRKVRSEKEGDDEERWLRKNRHLIKKTAKM